MAFRAPRALVALPLLGLLLSVGCDGSETALRSVDLDELPDRFACEDVTVVAAAVDGSEALLIGVEDGLVAAAKESGEVVEAEYELPDDRLTVRWVAGGNVYAGHCGRETSGAWHVDDRRDAISGTLVVRIAPEPDGHMTLDAELHDLLLASPEGEHAALELAGADLGALELDP